MPLIIGLSMQHFMGTDKAIPLQFDKILSVVAVILTPVIIGMVIRSKRPELAKRLEKPVRIISAVFLLLVIAAAVITQGGKLGEHFAEVGFAALVFNLASMTVGYFLPRAFGVVRKQAIAIGMEIGIHNGTLAIALALTVLDNKQMSIPPAIYSLIMFLTAAAFGAWMARTADTLKPKLLLPRRRNRGKPAGRITAPVELARHSVHELVQISDMISMACVVRPS